MRVVRSVTLCTVAIGVALLLPTTLHGQASAVVHENAQITGSAASLSGPVMQADIAVALGAGNAHVLRRIGGSWTEEAVLSASDGAGLTQVALSADVIVAGAWAAPNPGGGYGAAYVFRYDGVAWAEEARLTGAGGNFGIGVDVDGDVIVVGAFAEAGQTGAVYVFRYDGTAWQQEAHLMAADGQPTDQLGRRVSLDGSVVVASAWQADPWGDESGAAYVFRHDGLAWSQEAKLIAPDGATNDRFSSDVAVDRDVILVGARFDSHGGTALAGSAHVFRYDGAAWNHEAKLTASDAAASDSFGFQVSLDRNVALISSPFGSESAVESGSAYVFAFDGAAWHERLELTPSDGQTGDIFGGGGIAGGRVLIGTANAAALYYYDVPDTDADGIDDYHELFYGTDPALADTDGDGLLDGTEIDLAEETGCPDALDPDSDGDTLSDGAEVALGTDPCNSDSDADTIPDGIDPLPLDPGGTMAWIEAGLRQLCSDVDALDLSVIDAANDNARAGRRNAICNKLNAAANAVAVGGDADAIDQIGSLLAKLDGLPKPADWMVAGAVRDTLVVTLEHIVVLLGY